MTVSVLSETKFIDIHNEFLYYLRANGYATKNHGPYTSTHNIKLYPEINGRNIRTINSDLYEFILSLDYGYMPKLWSEGYKTLGTFGIVFTDDINIKNNIWRMAISDGYDNFLVFNPKISKFDEIKQKIDLFFDKQIKWKSVLLFK